MLKNEMGFLGQPCPKSITPEKSQVLLLKKHLFVCVETVKAAAQNRDGFVGAGSVPMR